MSSLISKMGIGCWQVGGVHELNGINNGWQPMERIKRVALIERAIELGFTFFDTASGYGDGESEEILGLGILNSGKRDKVKICTKIKIKNLNANESYDWNSFEKTIQKSLSRLNVDKIDLLLLHNPSKELLCQRYIDLFEEAKTRSIINNYGVSLQNIDDLELANKLHFGNSYQWNFSILEKRALNFLETCKIDRQIIFIGRSLLYRGLLTENFLNTGPETNFDDARSQLTLDLRKWVYKNTLNIQQLAKKVDLSVSQLAILFGVMNPSINIGLIGIRTFQNLDSLEELIGLSQSKINACYELANNYEPLSFN